MFWPQNRALSSTAQHRSLIWSFKSHPHILHMYSQQPPFSKDVGLVYIHWSCRSWNNWDKICWWIVNPNYQIDIIIKTQKLWFTIFNSCFVWTVALGTSIWSQWSDMMHCLIPSRLLVNFWLVSCNPFIAYLFNLKQASNGTCHTAPSLRDMQFPINEYRIQLCKDITFWDMKTFNNLPHSKLDEPHRICQIYQEQYLPH